MEFLEKSIPRVTPLTQAFKVAIKYGTMDGGSTASFFKNSKIPTMQKMWASMIEMNMNTATQESGIKSVLGETRFSSEPKKNGLNLTLINSH